MAPWRHPGGPWTPLGVPGGPKSVFRAIWGSILDPILGPKIVQIGVENEARIRYRFLAPFLALWGPSGVTFGVHFGVFFRCPRGEAEYFENHDF